MFTGKIALVTGANRGIGRAIAEILAVRNARVIGTATSETGVNVINTFLSSAGQGLQLDVANPLSINTLFKTIRAEIGEVDILINNAGIIRDNLLVRMTEEEWQCIITTNLTSVFRMSKAVIRAMLKKHYGRIITIGSIVGSMGNIGQTNYAAAKAGVIGFSKSLAREVAARKITVNVVEPGFITTNMTKMFTDKYRTSMLSQIPMNYFGDPQDIASVVAFLASQEAAYITGETIHVNGGLGML